MKWQMKSRHEHMLVATLVGLMIVGAAGVAVSPAKAGGYPVEAQATVSGLAWWDQLNVRKWPAFYSQKVGALAPNSPVWVERCIQVEQASDWCKIDAESVSGWVNSRYLIVSQQSPNDEL